MRAKVQTMWKSILFAAIVLVPAAGSWAQDGVTPFFFPGSIGYEATISTVTSGPFLAEQSIVSADRRYVTINVNVNNNGLVALTPYTFATVPNGYVGETTPAGAKPGAAAAHAPTILDRAGMTFLGPLKP
jgi:hypothetical protein